MRNTIVALITAGLFVAGSAEAGWRPPSWLTYAPPAVGEYGTGASKAWNYYCENGAGEKVRAVVDSANAPALKDPNAIYVYQVVRGAHPLTEQFRENRVLVECRKVLGPNVSITGVDEVIPDHRR